MQLLKDQYYNRNNGL